MTQESAKELADRLASIKVWQGVLHSPRITGEERDFIVERLNGGAGGVAQGSLHCGDPVMWVCLVPGPAPAGGELRIRAWTADRKRMESLVAEGLDMQALYTASQGKPDCGAWRPMSALPDVGRKFICLYSDGSGAVMFWRHDDGYIDHEGDERSFEPDQYDRWSYLPAELEFWCETRAEDPMCLSLPSTGGGTAA